jgi:hypothetical protein
MRLWSFLLKAAGHSSSHPTLSFTTCALAGTLLAPSAAVCARRGFLACCFSRDRKCRLIQLAMSACLAYAGFATGRWLGIRNEPGVAHYLMALFLACYAVYLVWAPRVSLDPRWVSLVAGGYVGLSLGSFLRQLWQEERGEWEAEARPS